ncbi:MAG: hypothetical protein M0Z60_05850, partial [Nitrospiraceae bacterium]|nr:hypothetical protein [Nitrospiraceae bacterium]
VVIFLIGGISEAVPTTVVVRAKAKDAKFIGTMMGGALVVIRSSETGEILAKGLTKGGTGDTKKIMIEPVRRGAPIADNSSAKFEAVIDIAEPVLATIEVTAPYAQRQSAAKTTTQFWLIPGKDIVNEDGITMDVYGFSIDVLAPQAHEVIKLAGKEKAEVVVRTNVVMMCGCPIMPGGIWDANKYEVKALIKHNGAPVEELPLSFAGKTSTFEGTLQVSKEGAYEVTVYAFDPATGNSGVDRTTFMVTK